MDSDPALARELSAAVDALAACLATDVEIDPTQVFAPLVRSMSRLAVIATELSMAAMSVNEPAGLAAGRAAEHCLKARGELAQALTRFPDTSPRGRLYGRPRNLDPSS
jgi:hypothetical protein